MHSTGRSHGALPGSPFTIGQVITLDKVTKSKDGPIHYAAYPPMHIEVSICDKYPHLFAPLPWWADRNVEEMPEYVAFGKTVYRAQWDLERHSGFTCWAADKEDYPLPLGAGGVPATLQDYEAYLKTKAL